MKTIIISLLIITIKLNATNLEKVNINDFIDNHTVSSFTTADDGLYVVIGYEFYKLDVLQKSLEKVYTAKSRIIAVNYIDDNFYVSTFDNGTIVLDINYNFIRDYTKENSKLKFVSTTKTVKGINNEIFILNDGCGLLKITKDTSEFYDYNSFLGTNHILDMYAHNGKYYFALTGRPSLITDSNLNVIDTVDLIKLVGFEYYLCDAVYAIDKYIIWTNQIEGIVIQNIEKNTYLTITRETHKIQDYSATNFIYDNNYIFICNSEGLYLYNPETGEEKAYRITKEPSGGVSPSPNTIFDIVKIDDIYYVSTRNGIYYLNESTSNLIEIKKSDNTLFSINADEIICNKDIKLEVYNLNSKLIFSGSYTYNQTLNLRDILKSNTFYLIKVYDDKKLETVKYILTDN